MLGAMCRGFVVTTVGLGVASAQSHALVAGRSVLACGAYFRLWPRAWWVLDTVCGGFLASAEWFSVAAVLCCALFVGSSLVVSAAFGFCFCV